MSEYLKSTDYVNAYDLARDRRVISGKVRLTDMPRLREEICPTDAECVFEIKGMTAKKGWPGAVMTLAAKVPLICNHCGKAMEFPIEATCFSVSPETKKKPIPFRLTTKTTQK